MPKPPVADVVLDIEPRRQKSAKPKPDSPFHVLVMGDFTGRTSRGVMEPLLGRRPTFIDCEEIDTVMAKLGTHLRLPLGNDGAELTLDIRELDDFHPDRIFDTQPLFAALRQMRKRLENPSNLKSVTDEILGGISLRAPEPEAKATTSILGSGSLLDSIMEEQSEPAPSAASPKRTAKPADALLAYVHDLVKGHLTPGKDPEQEKLLAELDHQIGQQMRDLLHQPLFQSLEASWRSLDWLVRFVETSSRLKIYILDVTKAEILNDLAATSDLRTTGLWQLLVQSPVQAEPWALIGADIFFRPWIEDVELFARLAMVADAAGAPVISGADPAVIGVKDPQLLNEYEEWDMNNPVWHELRRLPEARRLGMALPRFMLRAPYGKKNERTERFPFEEMPKPNVHSEFLWGNAMYAVVGLTAQAFAEDNWDMRPGALQDIGRLPTYTYLDYGSSELKPCAEVLFTLESAENLMAHGLMPVLSMKGSDTVRVGIFQSIASPHAPLEGRWRG